MDFDIQTVHLDQKTRRSVNQQEKKSCHLVDSSGSSSKNERKRKDRQIIGSCQRSEKSYGIWKLIPLVVGVLFYSS